MPWIVDGHCDSIHYFLKDERALRVPSENGHWDIERAKNAGVKLQFMAAYIEAEYKPWLASLRGLELIEAVLRFARINKDDVCLVRAADDLRVLQNDSSIGLILSIEGGEILGESLFMLDIIYELGVRALGLTWNQRNAIGDGVGEISGGRLSNFGVNVVRGMNRLGMVVDVSHLNEPGFWHVLEVSEQPVIASHSCAKQLCGHPRNLGDEQIKAIAQCGGVIGVNFYPKFLTDSGQASIDDVVNHICHIAEVGGIEVVGFGSDFDGIDRTPERLEHVGCYGQLIEKLKEKGFSDQDLKKICHDNFFRVLCKVLK